MSATPSPLLAALREAGARDDEAVDAGTLAATMGWSNRHAARALAWVARGGDLHPANVAAALASLATAPPRQQAAFAFWLQDADEDGFIDGDELVQVLRDAAAHVGLPADDDAVARLAAAWLATADRDGDNRINEAEFAAVIVGQPDILPAIVAKATAGPAAPAARPPTARAARWARGGGRRIDAWRRALHLQWEYDSRVVTTVAAWALANVALFVAAWWEYGQQGANGFVRVARGFGATLDLNGALILWPVLRRLLNRLRPTWFAHALPLDHAIGFHRLVGVSLVVGAIGHTAAHLANYNAIPALGIVAGLSGTWAGATGVVLLAALLAMAWTARAAVRRRGHFRTFHAVHALWAGWLLLMLWHSPAFLPWGALPVAGLVIDQALLGRRDLHSTTIAAATPQPGRVTALHLARPVGFRHQAGDYAYLQVPAVSRVEWHPFTISSAPEADGVSFHVRAVGPWTDHLLAAASRGDIGPEAPADGRIALVDGPLGTSSAEIRRARVAVLVAGGIGATPFAAILESLQRRHSAGTLSPALQHVDFHWMNRGHAGFDWLLVRLREIEAAVATTDPDFLDVHLHMTGLDATQVAATALRVGLQVAAEHGNDPITGLRRPLGQGRPDWGAVLDDVVARHGRQGVAVFYCGPPGLAKLLRRAALARGIGFRKENF